MYVLIALLFVSICNVQSMQAMFRPMDILKVVTGSRYISSTPMNALCVYRLGPQDSLADKQVIRRASSTYRSSDSECSDDDEVAHMFNMVNAIKRASSKLKLDDVDKLILSANQVTVMKRLFYKEELPLIAAFRALDMLDDTIEMTIAEIQNVVPLEREIAGFQTKRAAIARIMSSLTEDSQWTNQYSAARILE